MADLNSITLPPRTCKKCGQIYPQTSDYWHKDKKAVHGLSYLCKTCNRARAKKWADDNPERNRERVRQWALDNPERVREQGRKYREEHAEEFHEYQREYAATHREEACLRASIWYADNTEQAIAYAHWYYRENTEKVAETNKQWALAHPEKVLQIKYAYAKRNPEKVRALRHKRRASGEFNGEDVKLQIKTQTDKRDNLRCWWCGGIIKGTNYHIDHRIPVDKQGTNDAGNLCIACPTCNLSKGAKMPYEWNGRLL